MTGAEKAPDSLEGPPPLSADLALFLDFDGTLVEIAETPQAVRAPPELPRLLLSLERILNGAIAIVSGSSLARIDGFLQPAILPAAGVYGAELRYSSESAADRPPVPEIARLVQELKRHFIDDARILIEDKRTAVAVHFRLAPERAEDCHRAVVTRIGPSLQLLRSECTVEAAIKGYDKGSAIRRLAEVMPWRWRKPVFVGDDRVDEAGFEAVAALGGYGVKVGDGMTSARYRLNSVTEVRAWLAAAAAEHSKGDP